MGAEGADTELLRLLQRRARDAAFCCVGLLFRGKQLEAILNILPDSRQRELRASMAEFSGCSAAELVEQIKRLRQSDMVEATGRYGPAAHIHVESLPVPLRRWLCARALECDGREDHQGEA